GLTGRAGWAVMICAWTSEVSTPRANASAKAAFHCIAASFWKMGGPPALGHHGDNRCIARSQEPPTAIASSLVPIHWPLAAWHRTTRCWLTCNTDRSLALG